MKQLFIIRHAKSSWKNLQMSDHDRPLNKRGFDDAPLMGKRLFSSGFKPEMIISSSALRARTTARIIADHIGFDPQKIIIEPKIYGASPFELIKLIQLFSESFERVMLVGHNPDITSLLNQLSDSSIDNVPTCGMGVLHFSYDKWNQVGTGKGKLLEFYYPKKNF